MRKDESATFLAAEDLAAACSACDFIVKRVAVEPATPALRTTKRSRGQQRRRAKEAELPAQERAALQVVPSFVRAVRAASPETAAAIFRAERKRLKRVRLLFSRDEPDFGAARHVSRVDEPSAAPSRAQLAQRRRRQAEAAATGILALPPDVFTPARCDERPPHDCTAPARHVRMTALLSTPLPLRQVFRGSHRCPQPHVQDAAHRHQFCGRASGETTHADRARAGRERPLAGTGAAAGAAGDRRGETETQGARAREGTCAQPGEGARALVRPPAQFVVHTGGAARCERPACTAWATGCER